LAIIPFSSLYLYSELARAATQTVLLLVHVTPVCVVACLFISTYPFPFSSLYLYSELARAATQTDLLQVAKRHLMAAAALDYTAVVNSGDAAALPADECDAVDSAT
jgi:hypothetical protein